MTEEDRTLDALGRVIREDRRPHASHSRRSTWWTFKAIAMGLFWLGFAGAAVYMVADAFAQPAPHKGDAIKAVLLGIVMLVMTVFGLVDAVRRYVMGSHYRPLATEDLVIFFGLLVWRTVDLAFTVLIPVLVWGLAVLAALVVVLLVSLPFLL